MITKSTFCTYLRKVSLVISFLVVAQATTAQITITSLNPYSQNFDNLSASTSATGFSNNNTLPGWYAAIGTANATSITGGDGNTSATGVRSFGSNSDRSFGSVTSTGTGTISYGVRFKNATGAPISKLIVSYTLEEWRGLGFFSFANGSVNFSYRISNTENSLTSTNPAWVSVSELSTSGSANGGWSAAALDGNANKTVVTVSINVNLANGQEIMLRWQNPATNSGNYLSIDDVSVAPITGNTNVYYNTYTTNWLGTITLRDITLPANWNTSPDGTGVAASAFTNSILIFDSKGTAYSLSNNLVIGTGAKLIVAGGELIVPNNRTLSGTIDVNDNATLTISNSVIPSLGVLGSLSTVNFNSSAQFTLPALNYGNLIVAQTSGVNNKNLGGATRVRTSLTLNGKLELGNHNLTLSAGATISGASSSNYIVTNGSGNLLMQVNNTNTDVEFPVGTGNRYSPIKLKQVASGISDLFSIRVIDSVYAGYTNNNPKGKAVKKGVINKTWLVDEAVKGGSNVTITLPGNLVDALLDFDLNQARISHYEGDAWDDVPANSLTLLTPTTFEISRSGITSFSPFAKMSSIPQPLPVELVSFSARRLENDIVCNWKTAQELNNAFFTIERSSNGREFTEAGTVKGKGTTSQASFYTFTDLHAPTDLVYYRLKQTDFDGTTSFSKIIAVTGEQGKAVSFGLYPNPSAGSAVLQTTADLKSPATVSILNAQGQLVKEMQVEASAMKAGAAINLNDQQNGVYFIRIVAENNVSTLRLVKQ